MSSGSKDTFGRIDRRRFIQYGSVIAGSMVALPVLGGNTSNASYPADETFWFQKPLNILQTNIRDIDAKDYDANAVVKYMLDTGCNVLVINAGAIVDNFRNPLRAAV